MAPTKEQAKALKAKVISAGGTMGNKGSKSVKASVQRYLKTTEAQLVEKGKNTLLMKGTKCSQGMTNLLRDLRAMLAPNSKMLTKKNPIFAFDTEGMLSMEFLTTKNDCALFALGSHNKKRPNNLIIGRTFDHQILDMIEFGVSRYKSINDYNVESKTPSSSSAQSKDDDGGGDIPRKRIGSKPLMLFLGELWSEHSRLQNLLVDFYRGDVVDKLILSGLDHILVFAITQQQNSETSKVLIHQRTYFCKLKKNTEGVMKNSNTQGGSKLPPLPYLIPCGPDIDYFIRREQWASPDVWKAAVPHSSSNKGKGASKKKNLATNIFGETLGRLHLDKQNVDKMQGRKSKALRRADKIQAQEEREALEVELEREKGELQDEFKQQYGFKE